MRRKGFTLFELLVVIAVLSVVSTIGVQMFGVVSDGWRTQDRRVALANTADQAIDRMRDDFAQVVSAKMGGVAISGEQRMEEKRREGRVSLEDDRITLPVQSVGAPGTPAERKL